MCTPWPAGYPTRRGREWLSFSGERPDNGRRKTGGIGMAVTTPETSQRIGLALGSGAARGWSHIGVIRAVEDAGIAPCCVAGTSIGALVGAAWAEGRLDGLEKFVRELTPRRVMAYLDLVVPVRGLLGGERLIDMLRGLLGDVDVADARMPFCAVAADLATGQEVCLHQGRMVDAVRASIAIPGIFTPAVWDGRHLVDGGLVNPVPVDVARRLGAEAVIAVDLNHDIVECGWCGDAPAEEKGRDLIALGTNEDNGVEVPFLSSRGLERFYRKMENRFKERALSRIMHAARPNIFDILGTSIDMVAHTITRIQLDRHKPELVVQPNVGHITLWDFAEAAPAIDEGYRAAKEALARAGWGR